MCNLADNKDIDIALDAIEKGNQKYFDGGSYVVWKDHTINQI